MRNVIALFYFVGSENPCIYSVPNRKQSYELSTFSKALSLCGNLPVEKIGVCVPDEMKDYCVSVFGKDLQFAESSHSLFSANANGGIYMRIVKGSIKSG